MSFSLNLILIHQIIKIIIIINTTNKYQKVLYYRIFNNKLLNKKTITFKLYSKALIIIKKDMIMISI
jgi:hypothetical protein